MYEWFSVKTTSTWEFLSLIFRNLLISTDLWYFSYTLIHTSTEWSDNCGVVCVNQLSLCQWSRCWWRMRVSASVCCYDSDLTLSAAEAGWGYDVIVAGGDSQRAMNDVIFTAAAASLVAVCRRRWRGANRTNVDLPLVGNLSTGCCRCIQSADPHHTPQPHGASNHSNASRHSCVHLSKTMHACLQSCVVKQEQSWNYKSRAEVILYVSVLLLWYSAKSREENKHCRIVLYLFRHRLFPREW